MTRNYMQYGKIRRLLDYLLTIKSENETCFHLILHSQSVGLQNDILIMQNKHFKIAYFACKMSPFSLFIGIQQFVFS